jgi:hypothetical protein
MAAATGDGIVPYPVEPDVITTQLDRIKSLQATEKWDIPGNTNETGYRERVDKLMNELEAYRILTPKIFDTKSDRYGTAMNKYRYHIIKILKELDDGKFQRGMNNLNIAYVAVFGFVLGSFDFPDRNKNAGTFDKYIFEYCASKTHLDKLASQEYQEKVQERSNLQTELSEQGNLDKYERKMRSEEIDKNVPMLEELLGFAKALFSRETSVHTKYADIRQNPYSGKKYERIEKKFDTILNLWTKDLKGKLDVRGEDTSDNDGSTEVHNDNAGPTEAEHEAEVPNVPVDEGKAWDDESEDEKDKEDTATLSPQPDYPTEESQIKQTLRLIESLATTPILPKGILDKINFRSETTTNMCKDLEAEKDKYKEISSFSDVHDENAKHYYQTMLRYLTGIQLYLTYSNNERVKEKNLENAYKHVFGLILGSFDLPQPEGNISEKLEFLYDADLFLRNNIKTRRAAEIIVENEEKMKSRKGDGTYGIFLQKLLAFTVCLLREDTAKLGRVNRYHLHEEYVDLHDLYIVLDAWKTTLQGEQDDNVEQEEDTKGEQEEYDNDKNFPDTFTPQPEDEEDDEILYPTKQEKKQEMLRLIQSLRGTPIWNESEVKRNAENVLRVLRDLNEFDVKKWHRSIDAGDNAAKYRTAMLKEQNTMCVSLKRLLNNGYDGTGIAVQNLNNVYTALFGFILGSFNLPYPRGKIESVTLKYDKDLFLPNIVKRENAEAIIKQNEENNDPTSMIFLQRLLAFAVGLLHKVVSTYNARNFVPMRRAEKSDVVLKNNFYAILEAWKDKLNESELAKPDWASTPKDDVLQNEQSGNNEAPQNISQAEITDRIQKYRKQMAGQIDSVNIHWRPIAIQAPADWYDESLKDVKNVTTTLKAAMVMHDFYTVSHVRTSKSGQEWDDIWPLARQITLENTTPNRPFLASVLETLQTSLYDAGVKRQSRNEGKTFFFGEHSYNRAYQRAIGFALICVKRLLWRWYMDATFENAVGEKANVEQYHGYLSHALFLLTICYRTVACYRAVQDSDQHDLNYTDKENLQKCNITRMQLETPVRIDIIFQGEPATVSKYRLNNPLKKPECCKEYVNQMEGICQRTYNELLGIWRLDATSWHARAKIYANRILLIHLDQLQRNIYGTNCVAKRYWSRKWNMETRRKEAVEEKWLDRFIQSVGNGQSFFSWMYQDFFHLQEDMLKNGFKSNPIFPGEVCFSRKYIRRVRYLKTSLKRVLYMMIYQQIPHTYECQFLIQETIVDASVYLEVVLAIYALQQSESHSLDYRTANWKWKCEAELAIPDAKPVRKITTAGWGK